MRTPRTSTRLAAVTALAVGLLVAFAGLGGAGLAQAGGVPGKGQYGKKVTICHKGKKTKRVHKAAVAKHLAHGDTLGRCDKRGKKGKGHKGGKHEKGADHDGHKSGKKWKDGKKDKPYKASHPGKEKRGKKG